MKATLASRAVPLLVTTMLVAASAWAQPTGSQTNPGSGAPAPVSPGATTAPATPPAAATGQASGAPSVTGHRAMPHHGGSSRVAVTNRQPAETMQDLVEHRITDLHSKLHITAEQDQNWNQFAQVMRDNAKEIDESYRQRAQKLASMSAVDNMQSYAQIEQQRAQDMQKLVPAFQTLYASLSDQQKKTADGLFRTYAASAQDRRPAAVR